MSAKYENRLCSGLRGFDYGWILYISFSYWDACWNVSSYWDSCLYVLEILEIKTPLAMVVCSKHRLDTDRRPEPNVFDSLVPTVRRSSIRRNVREPNFSEKELK